MPRCAVNRAGITLIELLIVLSLMSILAAAVLPTATPSVRERLDSAAHLVAADISYARSLALTNNSQYRIRYQLVDNQYILEHTGSNSALDTLPWTASRAADDPAHQQIVKLANLRPQGPPVALDYIEVQSDPVQPTDRIEFGPLGETQVGDETIVWLAAGHGNERLYQAIRVNPVTGLTWIDQAQSTPPVR